MSLLLYALSIFAGLYLAFKTAWWLFRQHVIRTTTIFQEIPLLRQPPPPQGRKIDGTAVIAGGSFAGFLAARILADYFAHVIIIETDLRLDPSGSSRVGQRTQTHAYLSVGLEILRALFPDFDVEARSTGAVIRYLWIRWNLGGIRFCHAVADGPPVINLSRVTLEALVRRLVLEYAGSNISVIQGTVTRISPSPDGLSIGAVTYRPREENDQSEGSIASTQTIPTAFFADCTGPSAISAKYLPSASAGSNTPWGPYPRHSYSPNISYKTALFTVPEAVRDKLSRTVPPKDADFGRWDYMTLIDGFTPTYQTGKAGYLIQKVDGDRLSMMYRGWSLGASPGTLSQFIEAIQDIQLAVHTPGSKEKQESDWVFDFLQVLSESVDDIDSLVKFVPHKLGECQWIEYEAGRLPRNFVAIGDARMRLNPIFGQGIAKILSDITLLNACFRDLFSNPNTTPSIPQSFSHTYFTRQLPSAKAEHDINRMLDYGYTTTVPEEGETHEHGEWFRKYWVGLLGVVHKDASVSLMVQKVMGGVLPGIDLFHPYVALLVFLKTMSLY